MKSPDQHAVPARETFLREWRRPCKCPLELRAEIGSIRCAHCDRVFVPVVITKKAG